MYGNDAVQTLLLAIRILITQFRKYEEGGWVLFADKTYSPGSAHTLRMWLIAAEGLSFIRRGRIAGGGVAGSGGSAEGPDAGAGDAGAEKK